MTRKKVKLAYITNDSARKATFKKRKKGLIKKVSELSTLCGIDACAIIYSPYESQPELWPNAMGVQRVVAQFKRMPEMEQTKKMVNQESYTRQTITKVSELLKKQQKENREMEITELMYQCLTGTGLQNLIIQDLQDLGWILDHKLKEINKRCESLKQQVAQQQQQPPPHPQTHMMHMGPRKVTHHDYQQSPHPQTHMMHMEPNNNGMMTREVMRGQLSHNLGLDLGMGLSMDTMQRPQWLSEWINNPNDNMGFGQNHGGQGHGHGHGHGHGGEMMMMPFNNNQNNPNTQNNPNWFGGFFP